MSNIVEAEVKLSRYLFPKSGHKDGDFAIVSVYIENNLTGEMKGHEQWKTATIKGNLPKMKEKTIYKVRAEETYNEKFRNYEYGAKFVVVPCNIEKLEDQRVFLQKILSEKQSETIIEAFGRPLDVILGTSAIEDLCKLKGIKEKTANDIVGKVVSNMDYSSAFIELEKFNLTNEMIKKLIDKYGSPETVVTKVKENPYILASEIDGVGFKKADELALKGGMSARDSFRFASFIVHHLTEQALRGKSYIPQRELMGAIIGDLEVDVKDELAIENIKKAIYTLRDENKLWWDENKTAMALVKYRNMEYEIASEIDRIMGAKNNLLYNNWETVVDNIEELQGWKYTKEQRNGVKTVLDNNVVVVTGLAGTGKTTVTKAMTEILKDQSISQCALSGRASQRMKESTGMDADTIHGLLKYTKKGFQHDRSCPLDTNIILFDEASMPSLELVLALLKATKTGSKLVIIGDFGQLSSIGAGNFFVDILESGIVPVVRLTEVHRQAQASAIISKSIDIRNQKQLFDFNFDGDEILGELEDLELCIRKDKSELLGVTIDRFKRDLELVKGDITKVQVIVATRQRGELSCAVINKEIQQYYNPNKIEDGISVRGLKGYEYTLFEGDKIIVTKNNRKVFNEDGEQVAIFNGNLGLIKEIDVVKKRMIVEIGEHNIVIDKPDLFKTIELAYAITCHKLQGSSAERVIVAIDGSSFMLLCCEWLYTAITRAEKYATLVGENQAVRTAISKVETNNKTTFLPFALKKIPFAL